MNSEDHKQNPSPVETGYRQRGEQVLVGGGLGANVFPSSGPSPILERARGSKMWDTDGNEYIDYCIGSGAMLLGHAHPVVTRAIQQQAEEGIHYMACANTQAIQLAEKLVDAVPSAERVRFTTTGSEATFHAMRLCRTFTGRKKILKFEGGFHGNHDYAMHSTAPRANTEPMKPHPDSAGIPSDIADLMIIAPFNDAAAATRAIEAHHHELAAVIVEPIQRNMHPVPGFLQALRDATNRYNVPLIFDEVISGFRYTFGGVQSVFGVTPDMTTLGKIIGGGTPLSAVVGRSDIMENCDASRNTDPRYTYVSGTHYGYPLGCAAGLATLQVLAEPGRYDHFLATGKRLLEGTRQLLARKRLDDRILAYGDGTYVHFAFGASEPGNYRESIAGDRSKLQRFHSRLLAHGIFVDPGKRLFLSMAHT